MKFIETLFCKNHTHCRQCRQLVQGRHLRKGWKKIFEVPSNIVDFKCPEGLGFQTTPFIERKIKNHYILIELGNDVFKAKANVSVIDPKDTIQRNENLINWDSDTVNHFVFTSTKNPVVFEKDKHVFQYKNKWIALLLINLEQIPCPVATYEYVLNTRKINENKTSGFVLVVKDGIYKPSDFTLENLSNEENIENVNLISSPNHVFF